MALIETCSLQLLTVPSVWQLPIEAWCVAGNLAAIKAMWKPAFSCEFAES